MMIRAHILHAVRSAVLGLAIMGLDHFASSQIAVRARPTDHQAKLFMYETPSGSGFLDHHVNLSWGDVDRDGDLDCVVLGFPGSYLMINDGAGRLTVSARAIPRHAPLDFYVSRGVALVDLDSDGDLDLVAGVYIPQGSSRKSIVRFWSNDGKGVFSLSKQHGVVSLSASIYSRAIAAGDLDGDGDSDLVYSDCRFLWNDGRGKFTQKDLIPGGIGLGVSVIRILDINRDGRQDLFVGSIRASSALWVNDGKGGYSRTWVSPGVWNPEDARFADLDGDGSLDLVMNRNTVYSVELFLNSRGSLLWKSQLLRYSKSSEPPKFSLGDIDGDGDIDVFVNGNMYRGPNGAVLLNDGKASFTDATQGVVEPRTWPRDIMFIGSELNDLDGDHDLDVGGLHYTGKSLWFSPTVMRNRLRHLQSPSITRLGQPLCVTMIAEHDHTFYLGIAIKEIRVPIPGWGEFRLDPTGMLLLPGKRLRKRFPGFWKSTVPSNPSLSGVLLRFQGLDVPPRGTGVRLTGLSRTLLVK
jgi:FG-GAP-like repeat